MRTIWAPPSSPGSQAIASSMTPGSGGARRWCTCRTRFGESCSQPESIPRTWSARCLGMANLRTLLVVAGLTIAVVCLAAISADDLRPVSGRVRRRLGQLVRPESVRVALAQAGLISIPVPVWILSRIGVALAAASIAWAWFRLSVLGLIGFLVVYQLIGTALAFSHRVCEPRHQDAPLVAVRHGTAVM